MTEEGVDFCRLFFSIFALDQDEDDVLIIASSGSGEEGGIDVFGDKKEGDDCNRSKDSAKGWEIASSL